MGAVLRPPLRAGFPDVRALDLLVSVVETGSLTGAARLHGLSQPTASTKIRNLERALGVTLLVRSTHGSVATPEGLVVTQWAKRLVDDAHELDQLLANLAPSPARRLRIAASYTVAEYYLPECLAEVRRERPSDSFALQVTNSATVAQLVRSEAVELGFVESPGSHSDLVYESVASDHLVVVAPACHVWASRASISAAELASTSLVMREEGSGTRETYEAALGHVGLRPAAPLLELGSTAAVLAASSECCAPTVVSWRTVRDRVHHGAYVTVAVEHLSMPRALRAVWLADRKLPEAAGVLMAELLRRARSDQPTDHV